MKYIVPYGLTDETTLYSVPYINGNPSTGTMGSIPPAASIEYDQREIVAVIQYAYDKGLIDFNGVVCAAPSNADLTQLLKAIFGMTNLHKLQADVIIYINSSTGDDTLGDGSVAKPYRTYQTAVNAAQALIDLNQKHKVTFHGTGTFTQGCYMAGLFAGQSGAGSIVFDNTAATFNVTHGFCFYINQGAQVTILGGSYSASSDGVSSNQGIAFEVGSFATIFHQGGTFNACDRAHMFIYGGVFIVGSYTIAGNAPAHVYLEPSATWGTSGSPYSINLVGAPNFSDCFVSNYGGHFGTGSSNPFSGAATGVRYQLSGYGSISTNGAGPNFLPGNVAGVIAAGTGNGEYT